MCNIFAYLGKRRDIDSASWFCLKRGLEELLNECYNFGGRKFEHALKHGARNGLFIVTLGWFVDSVRKNGKRELPFVLFRPIVVHFLADFENVGIDWFCIGWLLRESFCLVLFQLGLVNRFIKSKALEKMRCLWMNWADSRGFLVLKTLAFQLEFAQQKSWMCGFLGNNLIGVMTILYLATPCMLT